MFRVSLASIMLGRNTLLARSLVRNVPSRRWASTKVYLVLFAPCLIRLTCMPWQSLRDTLHEVIPAKQEQLKKLVRLLLTSYPHPDRLLYSRKLNIARQWWVKSR